MFRRFSYCLLAIAVVLASCGKKENIIPRKKMSQIYAEMFVMDQRIMAQSSKVKSAADTSLVYEPIFEKYGYTSDDFRASMNYYIRDANRYARILRKTGVIIEDELVDLRKQRRSEEMKKDISAYYKRFAPEGVHYMISLSTDYYTVVNDVVFYTSTRVGHPFYESFKHVDGKFVTAATGQRGSSQGVKRAISSDREKEEYDDEEKDRL